MSDPTTQTGKQLVEDLPLRVGRNFAYTEEAIAAVEAEARLDALRSVYNSDDVPATLATAYGQGRVDALAEAAKRVRMLPKWDKRSVPGGFHVNRAAVLAILEEDEP